MPLRVAGQQVDGVALLDVLGEHQQRHVRPLLADHQRGAHALVGERRRHPDVDHAHVGLVLLDGAQQRLAVGDAVDDVEAALVEQAREALAQQHGVLGDHGSHGNSTRRVVPPPGGLDRCRSPSTARTRSRRPLMPMPVPSAPPLPLSSTSTTSRSPRYSTVSQARVAWACLATLVSASATTK